MVKLKIFRDEDGFIHQKTKLIVCMFFALLRKHLNSRSHRFDLFEFFRNLGAVQGGTLFTSDCLIDKSEISTLILGGDWNCSTEIF